MFKSIATTLVRNNVCRYSTPCLAATITFLPQTRSKNSSRKFSCSSSQYQTPKTKSVVYLLGWTGCKEKNLKKYTDFYEEQGFSVEKYCPASSLVFGANPKKILLKHSSHILKNLYAQDYQNGLIYFHNFSNGGTFMYYTLLKEIEKAGLRDIKIAGTIFDSGPCPNTLGITYRAAYNGVSGSNLLKASVGSLAVGWIYFILHLNALRARCKGMTMDIERYRYYVTQALAEMPNHGPEHFIYSSSDLIIPDYGVEWFMTERQKKGVNVSCTKFGDSAHVKHAINHSEEYLAIVDKFISTYTEGFSVCDNAMSRNYATSGVLASS